MWALIIALIMDTTPAETKFTRLAEVKTYQECRDLAKVLRDRGLKAHLNSIPFAGTVGNDTLISPLEGPRISIHLYLPIKYEGVVKNIVIVKHKDVRRMKEF
jgi:hypothetical protein